MEKNRTIQLNSPRSSLEKRNYKEISWGSFLILLPTEPLAGPMNSMLVVFFVFLLLLCLYKSYGDVSCVSLYLCVALIVVVHNCEYYKYNIWEKQPHPMFKNDAS